MAKAQVQGKRPELYLVDLPGYGFAKAGKQEQRRWKAFIRGYLESRDMSRLRRVFVLIGEWVHMCLCVCARVCAPISLTNPSSPSPSLSFT